MRKLIFAILVVVSTLVLATCERSDMYDIAKYGLAPRGAIYLYPITTLSTGDAGNDDEANMNCYTAGIPYLSVLSVSTIKAFRSFSLIEEIRFIVPVKYWQYPVFGISSTGFTRISSTWAGLWDGAPDNPINTAVGIAGGSWWSGSNADGSIAINTCNEWGDSSIATSGQVGGANISEGTATCDTAEYLLCVAY